MELMRILESAVEKKAADILLVAGLPVSFRIFNNIERQGDKRLAPADTELLASQIYELAENRPMEFLQQRGDDDFSFSVMGLSRFRVNVFQQRGSLAAVIRIVRFALPDYRELGLPDEVMAFAAKTKGFVLVTGPAGSGKSTTLACIIDAINKTRNAHIITIEDPIEFLHRHDKSVVTQREISTDTQSYDAALRAALRQSPDVILVGEMRDYETIRTTLTAAETGHLVISTLHTLGAAKTIDRIIDAFPPAQQHQIRIQLAGALLGIVSQQLVPAKDGGLIPAFEILLATGAVCTMIRESRLHQIDGVMLSSQKEGMVTMDGYLAGLVKDGKITPRTAISRASDPARMEKRLAENGLA